MYTQASMSLRKSNGNILFLILIAVALFAALSFAVTQSTRSGWGNAERDKIKMQISKLENFQSAVRTSLTRMKISGGLQFWQIDYSKPGSAGAGTNATCTSDSCRLHAASGGALIPYRLESNYWGDAASCPSAPTWGGRYIFINTAVRGAGVSGNRDLMLLYQGVSKDLCVAVNEANGVTNTAGEPPTDGDNDTSGYATYSGTIATEVSIGPAAPIELGSAYTTLNDQQMFCFKNNPDCYYLWINLFNR